MPIVKKDRSKFARPTTAPKVTTKPKRSVSTPSSTGRPAMESVESSNIAKIGYKAEDSKLFVEFNAGTLYSYDNVPQSVFQQFQTAESKGKFFHQYIRKGGYAYTKLS